MQGSMVPVVLLPRFTTFVGAGSFATAPLDVTEFDRLVVDFGRGAISGGGTMTCEFQDSHDCVNWFALDSVGSAADVRINLTRRWLRVVITLGSGQAVTCWCAGQLRRRVQ